jgi:anti-sigma regulatory factor (Ser/Thr protein kinase)
MADSHHRKFALPDRSYQGMVRSELRKLAEDSGFKGHRLGEIEIIIAEITSNLVKHATRGGFILARSIKENGGGMEMIAIDHGPGMRMVAKMMEDGQSTKKTLGQGLGAIRRLSNEFDMYSIAGWGTVLFSRCYVDKEYVVSPGKLVLEALCVAKKDQLVCGDAWSINQEGRLFRIAMIDGLGHGAPAHAASILAVEKLKLYRKNRPTESLRQLHEALKKTRGAVITIVHIDQANHQLTYSGVGNISMKIISAIGSKGCFSYNGIVGHILPASLNDHLLQWNEKMDTLIMHSDGISSRWDLQKYPGILVHHPIIIGASLYKDHDRGNDDSTLLVAKFAKEGYG